MLILKPFSIERSVAGAYDYGKHFHYAWESTIRMLAHVLDSLVRVSRRVEVHSPLLRESYLVSFPPLTYMLKFSGFADLTSCLGSSLELAASSHLPRRDNREATIAWQVARREGLDSTARARGNRAP
jgi:hypothetical protein